MTVVLFALSLLFFPRRLDPGWFIGWTLLVLFLIGPLALIFWSSRGRTYNVWLSQEDDSVFIRTETNYFNIVPKTIEWKESKSFVLSFGGGRIELTFKTLEEADMAVHLMKTRFSELQVVHGENPPNP